MDGKSRRRQVVSAILKALAFGADPDARDAAGNTILFYHHAQYFDDVLEAFVKAGGNVNARNKFGETAMHYHFTNVRVLKEAGADANATDRWGDTPLHTAARLLVIPTDIVKHTRDLLSMYNVNAVNHKGQTPLFHAMYHPNRKPHTLSGAFTLQKNSRHPFTVLDTVSSLLWDGADVNHADIYGRTPMHVAVMRGKTEGMYEVARTLKLYGASVHAVDRNGRTPLAYVARGRPGKRTVAGLVSDWTSWSYQSVREVRSSTPINTNYERLDWRSGLQVNQALATFMRNSAPRMPDVPAKMNRPKFLYRGFHGIDAVSFRKNGYIDSKSYIATSRSLKIALGFKYAGSSHVDGVILKIPFESIPHGTPMVWFAEKACVRLNRQARSTCEEAETLLPPGRLQIVGKVKHRPDDVYKVRYIPDLSARAKYNTKPIVRQPGRARRNINDTGPLMPWMKNLFEKNSGTTRRAPPPRSSIRARTGRA